METKLKFSVLRTISKVYEESKDCKLKSSFFKKSEPELVKLSGYFKVSKKQALLISVIFAMNYESYRLI